MNIQPIIDFDRSLLLMLNGSDNLFYDNLMAVLTSGLTWIPLYLALLVAVIKNNEKVMQILLVVGCALLCVVLADGGADFLAKPFFQRWRPSNDPMIKHMVHVVNGVRGGDYGFFSAHAANTFSLALFFSLLIRNRLLTFVMVLWSLLNCFTRIYLGMHYPGDILVGLMWGAVSGIVAYIAYRKVYYRMSQKIKYVSSQYSSTGYGHADVDNVAIVFVFTLLYAVLRALV